MGPFFNDAARKQNPILGAEDTNGYYEALQRQLTVYGDQWFKVTGKTPEGIPVEDRISPWRMLVPKLIRNSNVRKNTIDSQDLYLAGISGRDMLEGLYIFERVGSRKVVFFWMILLALPFPFYFTLFPILNPTAWLLLLSYFLFYVEFVQDFNIRISIVGKMYLMERMAWKLPKKRMTLKRFFLDFIAVNIVSILILIPIILVTVLIILFINLMMTLAERIEEFYVYLDSWMWRGFFLENQVPYHICAIAVFLIALRMSLTRESRRQNRIRSLIKTFEKGRRDYDAYFLCKVQKDPYDGLGWVTFFYDFGIMKKDKSLFEKWFDYFGIR